MSMVDILRPAEAINRLDRTKDSGRLMAYAVEHLMFTHPYKKFDLAFSGDTWIKVYDFEHLVCNITTYAPDGVERTALQLQFEYDYNVHNKAPRDTKRTSNVNKIAECVKMIRPAKVEAHIKIASGARSVIEECTKFSATKREFERVFANVSYNNLSDNVALFDDLLNHRDTSAVDVLRKKFTDKRQEYEAAQEHLAKLRRHSVMVTRNHSGDYRLVHRRVLEVMTDNRIRVDYAMVNYDGKDKLPPNIYGKVCLLEIAEQGEDDEKTIEGVGLVSKNQAIHPVYIIIGEDLEEPAINGDAGAKGQIESD